MFDPSRSIRPERCRKRNRILKLSRFVQILLTEGARDYAHIENNGPKRSKNYNRRRNKESAKREQEMERESTKISFGFTWFSITCTFSQQGGQRSIPANLNRLAPKIPRSGDGPVVSMPRDADMIVHVTAPLFPPADRSRSDIIPGAFESSSMA